MEGVISGRKISCRTSIVVLGILCLGSLSTVVGSSSELPFLQPLHHGATPESTQKLGTQHHWLRDNMPWSSMDVHTHHRFVHEYQPRLYMTANLVAKCEVLRRMRLEHGILPEHRFHLRGTSPASTPKTIPVNVKPAPGGLKESTRKQKGLSTGFGLLQKEIVRCRYY